MSTNDGAMITTPDESILDWNEEEKRAFAYEDGDEKAGDSATGEVEMVVVAAKVGDNPAEELQAKTRDNPEDDDEFALVPKRKKRSERSQR